MVTLDTWEVIASRKHFSILSSEEEMLKTILSCEEKALHT